MEKCSWQPPTASSVGAADLPTITDRSSSRWMFRNELSTSGCLEDSERLPCWKFLFRVRTLVSARATLPRWEKSLTWRFARDQSASLLHQYFTWAKSFYFLLARDVQSYATAGPDAKKTQKKMSKKATFTNKFDQELQTSWWAPTSECCPPPGHRLKLRSLTTFDYDREWSCLDLACTDNKLSSKIKSSQAYFTQWLVKTCSRCGCLAGCWISNQTRVNPHDIIIKVRL